MIYVGIAGVFFYQIHFLISTWKRTFCCNLFYCYTLKAFDVFFCVYFVDKNYMQRIASNM
jgi:hypothetical protein